MRKIVTYATVILLGIVMLSISACRKEHVKLFVDTYYDIWDAIDDLQNQIDDILGTPCECNNVSWKYVVTEDDIVIQSRYFSTVKISDSRILKDCAVSVYIVGDSQNWEFTSLNASYDISVEDGAVFLKTSWANCPFCINPPVGQEILIYLTYHE